MSTKRCQQIKRELMKKILISIIIATILIGGYILFFNKPQENRSSTNKSVAIGQDIPDSPDRPAEVSGNVLSVEGNVILIASEVGKELLPEDEREERQAERQKLTQEERKALRQEEQAAMETEDLELVIPVGVPISKGSGDSSGNNIHAEISEIIKGTYISVWLNEDNRPEFVKIKGFSQ